MLLFPVVMLEPEVFPMKMLFDPWSVVPEVSAVPAPCPMIMLFRRDVLCDAGAARPRATCLPFMTLLANTYDDESKMLMVAVDDAACLMVTISLVGLSAWLSVMVFGENVGSVYPMA